MARKMSDIQIRNMVFKAYLKKVRKQPLTQKDKDIIKAWKMAGTKGVRLKKVV